jgi:hypothetical protein
LLAIARESTTATARERMVFIDFLGNAALKKGAPRTSGRERGNGKKLWRAPQYVMMELVTARN